MEPLRFCVNQQRDPHGAVLRQMLVAQFGYERMQALRHLLLHALVLLGVVVWIAAVRPGILPPPAVQVSEAGWGISFVGLVVVMLRAHLYGKRASLFAIKSSPHGREQK